MKDAPRGAPSCAEPVQRVHRISCAWNVARRFSASSAAWRRRREDRDRCAHSKPIEGTTMNAIQLLKDDHKKVRGLLAELEATTTRGVKKRTQLLATIAQE